MSTVLSASSTLVLLASPSGSSGEVDLPPDRARDLLRRELLGGEYERESLLDRLQGWLSALVEELFSRADALSSPSAIAVVAIVFALALLLVLSLGRVRGAGRRPRERRPGAVLDRAVTSAELRARAARALATGDLRTCAVEAFRAAATREVEQGVVEDRPGATAQDVAREVARHDPVLGSAFLAAADVFDVALYGDAPVPREAVDRLLALAEGRPVEAWAAHRGTAVPR